MAENGCLIGFPNRIDESTLTGGSWDAALPLTNLKNRLLGRVARSTNLLPASTMFSIDLGASRSTRVISLTNHNFSLGATVRFRASNETSVINQLPQSENFPAWAANMVTVTGNTSIAPDGATTMDTLVSTAVSGSHNVSKDSAASLPVGLYTVSIFVKAKGVSNVAITQVNGVSMGAKFNLVTGVSAVYSGTIVASSIQDYGNGMYRLTMSYATTTAFVHGIYFSLTGPTGALVYAGNNVDGVYAWGAQLEQSSRATSYFPTTTTSATRPAGYFDSWQMYAYDSGTTQAYPAVYPTDTLEWESDSWWFGTYTQEEIEGYTANVIHLLTSEVIAQHWKVEINDSSNLAGYVQIGRVFIGPAWQPQYDAEVGLNLGWESNTTTQRALSGTKYYQRRSPMRVTSFTLTVMSDDESMYKAFELDKMAGIDKEVLWVHSTGDTIHALRRRFLGTLRQLTPIEFPYATLRKKAYTVEEVI